MDLNEIIRNRPFNLTQAQGWANYFLSQHDQLLNLAGQIIQHLINDIRRLEEKNG